MMNPNHLSGIIDDMIKMFMHEKMFRFIHIPVQSGNDRILKLMNRKYTSQDYKNS